MRAALPQERRPHPFAAALLPPPGNTAFGYQTVIPR